MKFIKKKESIIQELFFYSISYSAILIIFFSIFFAAVILKLENKKAEGFLKRTNHGINIFIEGYFKELVDFIEILSKDNNIINAQHLDREVKNKILKKYKIYQDINKDINYIYSAYTNKKILINNYNLPDGYDPTTRPWYKIIMDKPRKDKEVKGFLYQEIKSKEWLISTIKILKSEQYGYTGVIAVDSFSTSIAEKLNKKAREYDTAYSYILNKNGKVIIHQNSSVIGDIFLKEIKTNLKTLKEGIFFYSYKNKYKMGYLSRIKTTGWYLITTMDMANILKPIFFKIFFCFLFVFIFAVISGLFQSKHFMDKFISPFIALKKRMESVLLFEEINDSYTFPKNEIGYLSKQIEKITKQALYKKNIELKIANNKINEINTALEKNNDLLNKLAIHDSLTGIYNRQKIEKTFESEYYRFLRYKTPLSGILLDIDLFKSINDTFGHNIGDEVLKTITELISQNIRETDVIGRWGGEEFLIILPNTILKFAVNVAEKIKKLIMNHDFGISYRVTASLGVVEIQEGESGIDAFIRLDKKLYEAKNNGRNQVKA